MSLNLEDAIKTQIRIESIANSPAAMEALVGNPVDVQSDDLLTACLGRINALENAILRLARELDVR